MKLTASIEITIRFSEVDSMGIVWHGSYSNYFEEAREEFGRKYNLGYLLIFGQGYYAPLVKLDFNYKRPLAYGDRIRVEIEYVKTEAAKLLFNYRIVSLNSGDVVTTGCSTQVFLDKEYQLQWSCPEFYEKWKQDHECSIL